VVLELLALIGLVWLVDLVVEPVVLLLLLKSIEMHCCYLFLLVCNRLHLIQG
jgi:uncharacterized membrane protein